MEVIVSALTQETRAGFFIRIKCSSVEATNVRLTHQEPTNRLPCAEEFAQLLVITV